MIKKIEELKELATIEHTNYDCWGRYEPSFRLDEDKFAELIIKNCIQQVAIYDEVQAAILAKHYGLVL